MFFYMNLKIILIGMLFLSPHLLPYLVGSRMPSLALSKIIKNIREDAKEIAPTGEAVEAVERTEKASLEAISLLGKGSLVFGVFLVLIGLLI